MLVDKSKCSKRQHMGQELLAMTYTSIGSSSTQFTFLHFRTVSSLFILIFICSCGNNWYIIVRVVFQMVIDGHILCFWSSCFFSHFYALLLVCPSRSTVFNCKNYLEHCNTLLHIKRRSLYLYCCFYLLITMDFCNDPMTVNISTMSLNYLKNL